VDPYVKNPSAAVNPGPFREGDRVRLLWGFTPVEGTVIEDRGNRGVGGRRFYRVRIQLDNNITDPIETERPVDDLTLVARPPTPTRKRRRGKRAGDDPGETPTEVGPSPS
jgi:hypothetical protein